MNSDLFVRPTRGCMMIPKFRNTFFYGKSCLIRLKNFKCLFSYDVWKTQFLKVVDLVSILSFIIFRNIAKRQILLPQVFTQNILNISYPYHDICGNIISILILLHWDETLKDKVFLNFFVLEHSCNWVVTKT